MTEGESYYSYAEDELWPWQSNFEKIEVEEGEPRRCYTAKIPDDVVIRYNRAMADFSEVRSEIQEYIND